MNRNGELDAFIALLATYDLIRPVHGLGDLSDGAPLFDMLSIVDPEYFRPPARSSSELSENWVLRLTSLKRLFRLVSQYFADVLHQPTTSLAVPDLQAIAEQWDEAQTLALCRLVLALAAISASNKDVIERIQKLNERDQHALMRAIEDVMKQFPKKKQPTNVITEKTMTDDDHFYQIQIDRSRAMAEKNTLQNVYELLLTEHRALQTNFDDAVAEKSELEGQLREAERQKNDRRADKTEAALRSELDRINEELRRAEENSVNLDNQLQQQINLNEELAEKVNKLHAKGLENDQLLRQVGDMREATEKAKKAENVMEKYKKKLEESAEMRKKLKSLEEQNSSLVDKNASLEEEYRKVAAFRPLMDSYKSQIAELENKTAAKTKELETTKFQLDQAQTRLTIVTRERAQDAEALELYQERVKELELAAGDAGRVAARARSTTSALKSPTLSINGTTEINSAPPTPSIEEHDPDADISANLGGELDDAITGRTTTDLKLEIRALKRELNDLRTNNAEASRVVVLENLLEDAKRMKSRYEEDYLTTHREKLALQSNLEEIRSGKSMGDGPEAALALRQRLNEVVEQLEEVQKQHNELQVAHESQSRELTIAKSDLNLVNKDQLEILATLRESVNEDKTGLESEVKKLQEQIRDLKEKNKMQMEQVNALLMDKVSLQTEGLTQREKMLERERNFTDLRSSFGGGTSSADDRRKILELSGRITLLEAERDKLSRKWSEAKKMLKDQDKMIRGYAANGGGSNFEEAERLFREQVQQKDEALAKARHLVIEDRKRYEKEQRLMLSTIHALGMETLKQHHANHGKPNGGSLPAGSYLSRQREKTHKSLRGPR